MRRFQPRRVQAAAPARAVGIPSPSRLTSTKSASRSMRRRWQCRRGQRPRSRVDTSLDTASVAVQITLSGHASTLLALSVSCLDFSHHRSSGQKKRRNKQRAGCLHPAMEGAATHRKWTGRAAPERGPNQTRCVRWYVHSTVPRRSHCGRARVGGRARAKQTIALQQAYRT